MLLFSLLLHHAEETHFADDGKSTRKPREFEPTGITKDSFRKKDDREKKDRTTRIFVVLFYYADERNNLRKQVFCYFFGRIITDLVLSVVLLLHRHVHTIYEST